MTEVLDLPALQRRLKGKKNRLVRLAAVYAQFYQDQLADIASAVSRADSQALCQAAHTFKGTVLTFEASQAVELALELENRGRQGQLEGAAGLLERLQQEAERLRAELEALVSDSEAWPCVF